MKLAGIIGLGGKFLGPGYVLRKAVLKADNNFKNMKKQIAHHHTDTIMEEAQALIAATAEVAGEKVVEARSRLTAALQTAQEMAVEVRDKAVSSAKAADKAVRKHPYQAMAIGFGLGALVAYVLSRRAARNDD
jgi:ElaB/YqjD/DUF883 family membrane-anchored ribosome-binding protein